MQLAQIENLVSGRALKPYEFYSDKIPVGRLSSFYFLLFSLCIFAVDSALAASATATSFRYEGRMNGPGVTGVQTNQTFTVSIRRPDNCGGNLGLSPWVSSTVTMDNGAFSISPTFDPALLAKAMDPWNDFSVPCATDFRRQLVINWNGENFPIEIEDAPRASLASFAVNAGNSAKIGNVDVQTNLTCSSGQFLRFNSGTVRFECQTLAAGDIPAISASQIPALAGDVSGLVTAASVDKIKGVPISVTAPANNQVLKFMAGAWTPAADDTGAAPADSSYAAKGVVQINTDLATSGLFISGGVLALPNVIGASTSDSSGTTVPSITYDQKGRITGMVNNPVNDMNKLPLAGGTMSGDINMNSHNLHSATKLGVGTSSPGQLIDAQGNDQVSTISVMNKSSSAFRQTGFYATNYTGAAGGATQFLGKVARGSAGAPAQVLVGDHALDIMGMAHDGSSTFYPVGGISIVSEDNITSTSSAGSVRISTTQIGTNTPMERMRVSPNGNVGIGTTSPNVTLEINGAIRLNNELTLCNAAKTGALRYNTQLELCDGSSWKVVNGSSTGYASINQGGTNNNSFNMDQPVFYNGGTGKIESYACTSGQALGFAAGGAAQCENTNMPNTLVRLNGSGTLVTPSGIEMPSSVTIKMPEYPVADPGGLVAGDRSRMWYNVAADEFRYWNGTVTRKFASQDGSNNFSGNNSFSGANTFTGSTGFTSSVTANGISATSVTVSGPVSGNSVNSSSISATTSLQVGGGTVITGILTCSSSSFGLTTSTNITCPGVTGSTTCNCQWNALPGTFASINYIVPGSGNINVNFGGSASAGSGAIKCICIK